MLSLHLKHFQFMIDMDATWSNSGLLWKLWNNTEVILQPWWFLLTICLIVIITGSVRHFLAAINDVETTCVPMSVSSWLFRFFVIEFGCELCYCIWVFARASTALAVRCLSFCINYCRAFESVLDILLLSLNLSCKKILTAWTCNFSQ